MANYLDPYASELQGIQRQQEMAKMLLQQGQQQPQEQMVSGRVAPINPLQAFLPALNTYQGMNLQKNAESEQKKLADMVRGERQNEFKDISNLMFGSENYNPAVKPDLQKDDMGNLMPNVQEQVGTAPNIRKAFDLASMSQNPQANALASALYGQLTKQPDIKEVPQGGSLVGVKNGVATTLFTNPAKEEKPPVSYQEYQLAKKEGFNGSYNDYQTLEANRKRPITNVHTGDTTTNQLSTAFLGQAKPYIEIAQAYRKVISAPESAAGDMSKIFGYMKILDPGSTVREGEAASAQNAAGVPDRILNLYNKALTGQRLNPVQRADFDNSAYQLVESQKQQFDTLKTHFRDRAISQNANPNNVIYDPFQGIEPFKPRPTEKPKQDEFKGTGRGSPFKPTAPRVVDFNSLPSSGG